jgi:hypothetical protein
VKAWSASSFHPPRISPWTSVCMLAYLGVTPMNFATPDVMWSFPDVPHSTTYHPYLGGVNVMVLLPRTLPWATGFFQRS